MNQNILKRLWVYQKERFPFFAHGLLILVFTFSAISFSRLSRGVEGFVSIENFLIAFFTSFSLFLLLRILDEFKDKEDDAKYRKHLPVPRGLVTLKELKVVGWITFIAQLTVIILFQKAMLPLYLCILLWLFLMTNEFFVPGFLKPRLVLYASLHMLIIPFIDLYVSGIDWNLENAFMHKGLIYFFLISFFNGMVLEVGRKIKVASQEAEGVQTYSKMLGFDRSIMLWLIMLALTCFWSVVAIMHAGLSAISYIILFPLFISAAIVAIRCWKAPTEKKSKQIEIISGVWTLVMYAVIGGLPGLISYIL